MNKKVGSPKEEPSDWSQATVASAFGVPCGALHLAQWRALEQSDGDVGASQGMRIDTAGEAGAAREAGEDGSGVVTLHPVVPSVEEQRTLTPVPNGLGDRLPGPGVERDGGRLEALAELSMVMQ